MNTFKTLLSVLFAVSVLCHSPAFSEVLNRVVAIVNDEVVTLYELNSAIKRLTGMNAEDLKESSEQDFLKARRRILDILIDEKIALEKIKELEIQVTEKEVDAAIEKIKENNQLTQEVLDEELKKRGLNYESYREDIKRELERARLINYEVKSKIILREEEIEAYYSDHKDEFNTEERVRIAVIFLKQNDPTDQDEADALYKRAQGILKKIKSGEDFAELARKFSEGPAAQDGGDLGAFRISELNPEMAKVVKDHSAGEVSAPIVKPTGIQIIKVVEKQAGGAKSLDQVRDAIHSILYKKALDKKYSSWIKELRKNAYTKVIF